MIHHQHALAIYQYKPKLHIEMERDFDARNVRINFNNIKTTLNEMYEEGKRALKDEDFKEDDEVIENIHSCDACEANTDEIRFVCLNCRSFQLCTDCFNR